MSTRNLLAKAGKAKVAEKNTEALSTEVIKNEAQRIKKTITLDPNTVKILHRLKAHISIEDDTTTDFGRIIDEAVTLFAKEKGVTV